MTSSSFGADLDPRIERTRAVCQAAVRDLLLEGGPEAITHVHVAERSGLGRATLYRHWPERSDLLLEAVRYRSEPNFGEPTGDLRADLITVLRGLRDLLADDPFAPIVATLIARAEWEPEMRLQKHELYQRGSGHIRAVLDVASRHGDIPDSLDLDMALSQLAGPIFFRRYWPDRTTTDADIEYIVDTWLSATCG